jgi:hypothetical protein
MTRVPALRFAIAALVLFAVFPAPVAAQTICQNPTAKVTAVGTAAAAVPATPLIGRSQITICNSDENAAAPVLKCRSDGDDPTIGAANPGDVLRKGTCWTYYAPSGLPIKCIADTADTKVTSSECKAVEPLPMSPPAPAGSSAVVSGTVTADQGAAGAAEWLITGAGTAGSPVAGVVSMQGVAGGTPVPMSSAFSGPQTVSWDSTTPLDTALEIATDGFTTIGIQYTKVGVITTGKTVVEVSNDGVIWSLVSTNTLTGASLKSPYPLTDGSAAWQAFISGFRLARIRLSTVITGAGSADWSIMASQGGTKSDVVSASSSSTPQSATWDSTTPLDTALEISVDRFTTVGVQFTKTGTIDAGRITFEVSSNGVWKTILGSTIAGSGLTTGYNLSGNDQGWQIFVSGFLRFRIRLSTAITNTGTAAFYLMASQAGAMPAAVPGTSEVEGDKETNTAIPGDNNVGVLPAVANAAAPTFTETYQTALSTTLTGDLRTTAAGATDGATSECLVVTTAGGTPCPASPLAGRRSVKLFNLGPNTIYCALGASVPVVLLSDPIFPNGWATYDAGPAVPVTCIAATANQVTTAATIVSELAQ